MKNYDINDLQAHFTKLSRLVFRDKLMKQSRCWNSLWLKPSLNISKKTDDDLNIFCQLLTSSWISSIDLEFRENNTNIMHLDACLLPYILLNKHTNTFQDIAKHYCTSFNQTFYSCILDSSYAKIVLSKFNKTILDNYTKFEINTNKNIFQFCMIKYGIWQVTKI